MVQPLRYCLERWAAEQRRGVGDERHMRHRAAVRAASAAAAAAGLRSSRPRERAAGVCGRRGAWRWRSLRHHRPSCWACVCVVINKKRERASCLNLSISHSVLCRWCFLSFAPPSTHTHTHERTMAEYISELKTFAKDSVRLVKRCNKPDAKGAVAGGRNGNRSPNAFFLSSAWDACCVRLCRPGSRLWDAGTGTA